MRQLATFAMVSCLTLTLATAVQADVVVNQAPDTTTPFATLLVSDFDAASEPNQGDIFSLAAPLSRTMEATWYGGYLADDKFHSRPPFADVFTANFFTVTAGVVDTDPIASFAGLDLDVTRTSTGIFLPPDPGPSGPPDERFAVFQYQAVLDFGAIGATLPASDYLFSVVNNSIGVPDNSWYWLTSLQGSGNAAVRGAGAGDTTTPWTSYASPSGGNAPQNLAYTLAIPTPSTVSMLLLSMAIFGSFRIRRQRAN